MKKKNRSNMITVQAKRTARALNGRKKAKTWRQRRLAHPGGLLPE